MKRIYFATQWRKSDFSDWAANSLFRNAVVFLALFFTVFHHAENTLGQSRETKRKYSREKPRASRVSRENIFFFSQEIDTMCFLSGEKQ